MKKLLLAAFALSSLGSTSMATVTIGYGLGWSPGVPSGATGVLVVDTANDGFNSTDASLLGESLTVGETLGADDYIIAKVTATDDLGGGFGFSGSVGSFALGTGGVTAGDELQFYWFTPSLAADPLSGGQSYGAFRTDIIDPNSGGNAAFVIPADGSTVNIFAYGAGIVGGTIPDAAFTAADSMVVPEPQTGLLLGGAAFLIFLRRRRR